MWSLRRVADANDRSIRVREVYHDEKGQAYAYAETSWWVKLRHLWDWLFTPTMAFPSDFDGEPEWAEDLLEAESTGDWSKFKPL